MTVKDLRDKLLSYDEQAEVAALLWLRDDIFECARSNGFTREFTDDEADEILHRIDRRKDASIGITWDTLGFAISQYAEENNIE